MRARSMSCQRCRGKGTYLYATSATWVGGIAGQQMTEGTCDRCWGSGDEESPGENLRARLARERMEASE